jgi:NAD(P)H-hydrate epimerase
MEESIFIRPLTREEVRSIDRVAIEQYGMTGLVLMENAGRNAAEAIQKFAPSGHVCILCGKGNNGGDGYVMARHLELAGRDVRVISLVDPNELTGDAAANYRIAFLSGISIAFTEHAEKIGEPNVVVDCLLGTGASGSPREPLASAIRYVNQLNAIRIAIDLPSGLDCDSGIAGDPTFEAHRTLTFVAPKSGFSVLGAARCLGEVTTLSIGAPAKLLRRFAV